ncbi:MAG: 8-oxo-dGTP diphosphatase [Terrimicrobiaceae bacterium]
MDEFWKTWHPRERATLCFLIEGENILLIRKKRGLGAGKINAPGGRIEPGEEPHECAIRETSEEVGLTPLNVRQRGELHFQFADGYSLHCAVFVGNEYSGELIETDEALPIWTRLDSIPYEEMWADDIHWLPGMIQGSNFRGYFHFDGEKMLTKHLVWD